MTIEFDWHANLIFRKNTKRENWRPKHFEEGQSGEPLPLRPFSNQDLVFFSNSGIDFLNPISGILKLVESIHH